jgi:hypothetical protein
MRLCNNLLLRSARSSFEAINDELEVRDGGYLREERSEKT